MQDVAGGRRVAETLILRGRGSRDKLLGHLEGSPEAARTREAVIEEEEMEETWKRKMRSHVGMMRMKGRGRPLDPTIEKKIVSLRNQRS